MVNNTTTTLQQQVDAVSTQIIVTDFSVFPMPPFIIQIDDELMMVVAADATTSTLTVERAYGDTTSKSHLQGSKVNFVWTTDAYKMLQTGILNNEAKLANHRSSRQNTHGIDAPYYIAKTSRSDQFPDWRDIQNKPGVFPPEPHKHTVSEIIDISTQSVAYARSAGDQETVDGKHARDFAANVHTHKISDIVDLHLASVKDAQNAKNAEMVNGYKILAGPDEEKGEPGVTGRIYLALDSHVIYYDDGVEWKKIATLSWDELSNKPLILTESKTLTFDYNKGTPWVPHIAKANRWQRIQHYYGASGDSYISLGSSDGKLHLFIDGDVYQNEGKKRLQYADLSNVTENAIISKLKNVHGDGSGLDADLLDGKHANEFQLKKRKVLRVDAKDINSFVVPDDAEIVEIFNYNDLLTITLPKATNYIGRFLVIILSSPGAGHSFAIQPQSKEYLNMQEEIVETSPMSFILTATTPTHWFILSKTPI